MRLWMVRALVVTPFLIGGVICYLQNGLGL